MGEYEDNEPQPVEPPPDPEPGPPPPPGEILRAYDNGDGSYELVVVYDGQTEESVFTAREDDPYGAGPAFWAELQRAVAAGEITPEPPPPIPQPLVPRI